VRKNALEDTLTSNKAARAECMDRMKSDEGEALRVVEECKEVSILFRDVTVDETE